MQLRTSLFTIGILCILSLELLSQEQPSLENGRYKMKVKSSGTSWTYELIINDNRYTKISKDGTETTGQIIWSGDSYFALIKDGSENKIKKQPNDGAPRPFIKPFIEPNTSYELRNPRGRVIRFTAHPRGNLHIIRGKGKLTKLKN
jgi:hypothetical protein